MMTPSTASFFAALWQDFLQFAPSAKRVHALLGGGSPIVNDHIALRTFNTPELGLDALEPLILSMGYRLGDSYQFTAKKLQARHYEHPQTTVPKIFISELLLEQFSAELQSTIAELLSQQALSRPTELNFFHSGRHWELHHSQYQQLVRESEYAGWLAALGFRANHFTVSVNHLPSFSSVSEVNERLKAAGFVLNTAGGEIKGSPEVMLEQSSTMADRVPVEFRDGTFEIPGCFYEFAFRYPQADGKLYSGFVEASANKIFESTNAG